MGDKTGIEWTEATWNPIVGCDIVSPGCKNCYAMLQAHRRLDHPGSHYHGTTTSVNGKAVWTGKLSVAPQHIFEAPLRWQRPRKIFVNSMGDVFHEAVTDAMIDRVFAVMALSTQHTFQLLTKRAERMRDYFRTGIIPLRDRWQKVMHELRPIDTIDITGGESPLRNVWLGVSVEDQERARQRIPRLIETPAVVRFLSCEPLLSPFDLKPFLGHKQPPAERFSYPFLTADDWVIVGGESGPGARAMHPDWVRGLRDACLEFNVPFFFKQWGEWASADDVPVAAMKTKTGFPLITDPATGLLRFGKKRAGNMIDGKQYKEFPYAR